MQAAVLAPSQDPQPTPLFPELGPIADEPTQVVAFRRQPALSAQERASVPELPEHRQRRGRPAASCRLEIWRLRSTRGHDYGAGRLAARAG